MALDLIIPITLLLASARCISALPTNLDPALSFRDNIQFRSDSDPVPGESLLFNDYLGKNTPLPAKYLTAINATEPGSAGPDDLLFQNLLAAEWIIYSFYQAGVEGFTEKDFTDLGLPKNTYDRLTQIRDNEAGHVRIFQDQISAASVKPGPCVYEYGFNKDAKKYLELQTLLEISSMAFLTGLILDAKLELTKAALLAISEVESRHNAWSLIEVWNSDPFSGPSDTVFPYANQILDQSNVFVVPGSCPVENPAYPSPRQHLPTLSFDATSSTGHPGSQIHFTFPDAENQPAFLNGKEYYAVYFHGTTNITMPFSLQDHGSTVPGAIDKGCGVIIAVISDAPGATALDNVVAGPLILVQQPGFLTTQFA